MICLGHGQVDWAAVSGIGTVAGAIATFLAVLVALFGPMVGRWLDQCTSQSAVLTTTEVAIGIFRDAHHLAVEQGAWPTDRALQIRIKADHAYQALDRLLSRPLLNERVISVGAGAMSLMSALSAVEVDAEIRQRHSMRPNDGYIEKFGARFITAGPAAKEAMQSASFLLEVVERELANIRK